MAFGANLKRERELRGITLEEISKASKISIRLLKAIEMDRYDILPEGIFRKSFVKNYAKYLGMNEDKVLQEYALAAQAASPPSFEEKLSGSRSYFKPRGHYLRWIIQGLITLLMVGVIYWFFFGAVARDKEESVKRGAKPSASILPPQGLSSSTSSPPAVSSSSNTASSRSGVAVPASQGPVSSSTTSSRTELRVLGELAKKPEPAPAAPQNPAQGLPENPAPSGSQPGELTLGINATEECWLLVSSGNTSLYSGLLQPQEFKKFSIQKPLKLTFGNAGGVKLSVNGKPLTSVGKLGEVRVLEIDPENYQRYLASSP